jgi:hypothetical protein
MTDNGITDLTPKSKIYRCATDLCNILLLPYQFKIDHGNRETAIVFNRETYEKRPPLAFEDNSNIQFPLVYKIPDLADRKHWIVFEYEEETGPRKTGAHMAKKGHGHEGDEYTKRDDEKYELYEGAKIRYCRIWESDMKKETVWRTKIAEFLLYCHNTENIAKKPDNLKALRDLEDY